VIALALSLSLFVAETDDARAKGLFKEGETAYNLGQFETALAKYSEAYKLKALPGFLFNIAQCHRQLGQFERAAFFYGRFVDTSSPKAPNVELAKSLQAEMKQKETERVAKEKEQAERADELKKADDLKAQERAREELKPVQLAPAEVSPPPLVPPPAPVIVEEEPVYKKGWFWGVVVGAAVAVGGIAGGVGYVLAPKPRNPTLGSLQ
jgi:tetratricopeptide (TPR) repeat protein